MGTGATGRIWSSFQHFVSVDQRKAIFSIRGLTHDNCLRHRRWEGAPHLGTDNLVRLLRNMRHRLEELGGEIHFGTKMTDLKMKDGKVCGVMAQDGEGKERCFEGDSYVLATGHSARDVYESLHGAGVHLEAKGFAVGFRIEHPQSRINMIQYGTEWGACVKTGKGKTDSINKDFFGVLPEHTGMPVPSYRLATDKAEDGTGRTRGVYSFCMCPVSWENDCWRISTEEPVLNFLSCSTGRPNRTIVYRSR